MVPTSNGRGISKNPGGMAKVGRAQGPNQSAGDEAHALGEKVGRGPGPLQPCQKALLRADQSSSSEPSGAAEFKARPSQHGGKLILAFDAERGE